MSAAQAISRRPTGSSSQRISIVLHERRRVTVMMMFVLVLSCVWGMDSIRGIQAFSVAAPSNQRPRHTSWTRTATTSLSVAGSSTTTETPAAVDDDDDDGEDYEYVEYEALTEAEFVKSEWLVGTCWDKNRNKIDETWVRLITDENGKNVAYWGDRSEGRWSLDVASQFLAISKESLMGKQIWAGVVEDYYYLQGTVRGWTFWQPASVLGQWQAKRLGVDKEEAGVAPWFQRGKPNPQDK